MLERSLQDSTPIRMRGKLKNITPEGMDKLQVIWRDTFDKLLNDLDALVSVYLQTLLFILTYMVTVRVFNTTKYMWFKLFDKSDLLIRQDILDRLWDNIR